MTHAASLGRVRCSEATYPAGLRLVEHVHERACITLVARGGHVERGARGRHETPCNAGMVVVRPAGEPHANEIAKGGVVNVELELDDALVREHRLTLRPTIFRSPAALRLGAELRRALSARGPLSSLHAESLALETIAHALAIREPRAETSAALDRAYARIEAEHRTPPSIAELAAEAAMHPVSFARAFRARFGVSPSERMRQLRVAWAAEELRRDPARPLAAIALEAGFCDQSHLSRALVRAFGRTPGELRRST